MQDNQQSEKKLRGRMINGKFIDEYGRMHKFVPKDAEIIDDRMPEDNHKQPPAAKNGSNHTRISIEIREAGQTAEGAQVVVRVHCRNQFVDAVYRYDFETEEELVRLAGKPNPELTILELKQTALMTAQEEAVKIALGLLHDHQSEYKKQE
jgi:hypothetical protein